MENELNKTYRNDNSNLVVFIENSSFNHDIELKDKEWKICTEKW